MSQHDLKRTVQIMKAANSYMVVPDGSAAGAASFLMHQSIASNTAFSGAPGQGPSFEQPLGEALQNTAKSIAENLKKADAKKK
jgi:hypothetical protein